MSVARKPKRMRNRRDCGFRFGKQLPRAGDAALREVAVRRDADRGPERACEMMRAKFRDTREVGLSQFFAEMGFDEISDPAQAPDSKTAACCLTAFCTGVAAEKVHSENDA